MDCKDFERLMDDYLDGELPPAKRAAFESHADECAVCGRVRNECVTLRNRLKAELSPLEPDAVNAFHEYKRNIALREDIITPKRRHRVVRALSMAGVFLILVVIFLVQVPVSYSLPDGMSIFISFDPPLTEAPTFKSLILPKEFYEALSTDEALIENFTTVQDPDGLKSIAIGISSFDPEIAAKVYQGLITNYPALEAGKVEYKGREEDKHEPVIMMLKDKYDSDGALSDEEIERRIILKMPEIEKWVDAEILPLMKGIKIEVSDTDGNIENIEKKLGKSVVSEDNYLGVPEKIKRKQLI